MSQSSANRSEREQRLEQVLADYVRSIEAGQPLDCDKLVTEHPDLADDLRSFFRNRATVEKLAEPLAAAAEMPTIGLDSATTPDPNLVRYFGDYELLEEIARGGMGVVFKARQRSLGRLVALKMILSGQLASATDVQRFRQEAEAAANLDHPGIVPIFEIGEHEGQHYFSMKLIEGGSLRERLSRRSGFQPDGSTTGAESLGKARQAKSLTYDPRAAAKLMAAVARAVHHAHQRGVLHRDLKPGNILLDADGQPQITDFGLAQRVESGSDLTQSGAILGTQAYMAPEQSQAKKQLTTAADIYSLGAILYELLVGRPPFEAVSPGEVLIAALNNEPLPPRSINSTIERDLEIVCLKCLEKDPQRRYDSAAALAGDLERWLADEPILARPDPFSMRLARLLRRHRVWVQAGGLSLALILIGLIVALVLINGAKQDALTLAEEKTKLATSNFELAQKESHARADVEKQSAALNRALFEYAVSEHGRGKNEKAIAILANVYAAAPNDDPLHRSSANLLSSWIQLAPIRLTGHRTPGFHADVGKSNVLIEVCPLDAQGTTIGPGTILDKDLRCELRLSDLRSGKSASEPMQVIGSAVASYNGPHGARALIASLDGTARVWDVENRKPIGAPMNHGGLPAAAAFSQDGTIIMTASNDSARLWDARTGALIGRPMKQGGNINAVAFAPDTTTVLTVSNDKTARLWSAVDGAPIGGSMRHNEAVRAGIYSPDGAKVLTRSDDLTARLWDAKDGRAMGEPMRHEYRIGAIAFSPDGERIATGCADGTVRLWDARTCKPVGQAMKNDGEIHAIAYSPDGAILFAAAGDITAHRGEVGIWDAHNGSSKAKLAQFDSPALEFACSEDGATLLTKDQEQTVLLWDMVSGRPIAQPIRNTRPIRTVAYCPDGRTIFTAGDDMTAHLWDARNGKPIGEPMKHRDHVQSVAWSPDGRSLLTGSGGVDSRDQQGEARLWNARTGEPIGPPIEHDNPVLRAVFSADGETLLTFCGDIFAVRNEAITEHVPEIRLWSTETGKPVGPPIRDDGTIVRMDYNPREMIVATGSNSGVAQLWDARLGKPIGEPMKNIGAITSMSFSRDGTMLVAAYNGEDRIGQPSVAARLWDGHTGKPIAQSKNDELLMEPSGAVETHFSPDGKTVATMGLDSAQIWNVRTMTPIGDPLKHDRMISGMAYSPDGRTLLTGGDTTARFWDVWSGQLLREPINVRDEVGAVAYGPDGTTLLTATSNTSGSDTAARLWAAPLPIPDQLLHLVASTRVGMRLNSAGQIEATPEGERLRAWKELEAQRDWLAEQRTIDERRRTGWHYYEAAEAEARADWFAAEFHLRWLLKSEPDDADLKKRQEHAKQSLAAARAAQRPASAAPADVKP